MPPITTNTDPEAPKAAEFCDLIANAQALGLPGTMSGSAFRKHPKFVFRHNILLANEWNTNDYCFAEIFTEHPVAFKPWCNEPAAYADPYPRPVNGSAIRVYSTGRWNVEGPWQAQILDILDELRGEIAEARARKEARRAEAKLAAVAAREATLAQAAALYAGERA